MFFSAFLNVTINSENIIGFPQVNYTLFTVSYEVEVTGFLGSVNWHDDSDLYLTICNSLRINTAKFCIEWEISAEKLVD